MRRILGTIIAMAIFPSSQTHAAAPTADELAALENLPEQGYIVYGIGDFSRDDFAAYGISKLTLGETEGEVLSATGRCPNIHPENGNVIVYSEPVTPGSNMSNIVLIDAWGGSKRIVNDSPLPNLHFVTWTDRGTIAYTSSEELAGPTNIPHKMWITDTLGNTREITHNFPVSTHNTEYKGFDAVWVSGDRLLVRFIWNVYLFPFDQDDPGAGLDYWDSSNRIAYYSQQCGHTLAPDGQTFVINKNLHVSFQHRNLSDGSMIEDYPVISGGWSNDYGFSNEMGWACFTTEEGDCEIYVQDRTNKTNIRVTWTGQAVCEHNPDMWVGEIISTQTSSPQISPRKVDFVDSLEVSMSCATNDAVIYYTLDGSDPSDQSTQYTEPFVIRDQKTVKARAYSPSLDPSSLAERTFLPMQLRIPENPTQVAAGVDYAYYPYPYISDALSKMPDFDTMTATDTGTLDSFCLGTHVGEDEFAMLFTGFISIGESGEYTFTLRSDDGSKLYIGDSCVVDNDSLHGPTDVSGAIALAEGVHAIRVEYFDAGAWDSLYVSYAGPGFDKKIIPGNVLLHSTAEDLATIEFISEPSGTYAPGDTITLEWQYSVGAQVQIMVSTDQGLSFSYPLGPPGGSIVHDDPIASFDWIIPDSSKYFSDKVMVRISDYNMPSVNDMSEVFTIASGASVVDRAANQALWPGVSIKGRNLIAFASKNARIVIVDLHGRTINVRPTMTNDTRREWDLADLASGIYLIRIRENDTHNHHRFSVTVR